VSADRELCRGATANYANHYARLRAWRPEQEKSRYRSHRSTVSNTPHSVVNDGV
jgi:hypothetical protein